MEPSVWTETVQENGVLVLRLYGELDAANRDLAEEALIAAIDSAPALILDLSALTFCDSSGIAMFFAACKKAAAQSTALTLRNPQPQVRRVFAITGIGYTFEAAD